MAVGAAADPDRSLEDRMNAEPRVERLRVALRPFVQRALDGMDGVAEDRRAVLRGGVAFLEERVTTGKPVRMVFICTHNSRRSHLGQVWARVAADVFDIPGVETFSAGTEATACNIRTVRALESEGWEVAVEPGPVEDNPRYRMTFGAAGENVVCWSKTLADESLPQSDFAAMMCCGSADAACPVVPGASARVRLLYRDPKEADDTPDERSRYDERSLQIATEMLWMMREAATSMRGA